MLLITEQHASLAAFYAREAEDAKHGPEARKNLALEAQLFGYLVKAAVVRASREPPH
jgi:hypothetical protein